MGLIKLLVRTVTKPIRVKVRGKAGERKVNAKLNPLFASRDSHRQINNLIIVDKNGKSHQIDHVEIRENGIFCIETKNYIGWIFGDENSEKWTQTLYNGEKHQFYNPIKQNQVHCYHIQKILGPKYVVNSIVVMANDNADKIKAKGVVNLSKFRKYLILYDNGVHLSQEEMDYVYNKLLAAASDMTDKEHVQNIKKTQSDIKHNICPRCGAKLVLRRSENGKFYGCSNYPRCKFIKKV